MWEWSDGEVESLFMLMPRIRKPEKTILDKLNDVTRDIEQLDNERSDNERSLKVILGCDVSVGSRT